MAKFTHLAGEVLEVRVLTETHVSGTDGRVTSRTEHFNRCRVKWDDGRVAFANCNGDYSVGDRVALIFEGKQCITDVNLVTRQFRKVKPKSSPVACGCFGLLASMLVISLAARGYYFLPAVLVSIVVAVLITQAMNRSLHRRNADLAAYIGRL